MSRWVDRIQLLAFAGMAVAIFFVARHLAFVGSLTDDVAPYEESTPCPLDGELRATFAAHRADLEALRALISAEPDKHLRIDATAPLSGSNVRYLVPLAAVGGRSVQRGDDSVEVLVYAAGIVTSGVTKSFVWFAKPPAPIVADTDANRPVGYVVNYAALGDGWYIEQSSN